MDLTPNQRPRISRSRLDCLDEDAILELVERRLDPERAARVEQHVARCVGCRRLVSDAIRGLTPPEGTELGHAATAAPDDLDSDRTTDRYAQSSVLARGTTIDRYIVVDLLGRGGMGAVYRAFDPDLNRQVALKLVGLGAVEPAAREHARLRMLREAQALAKLQHPNVVAVHDVGRVGDDVFIAMELVDGWTLRAWLREEARPARDVLRVFERAGEGLAAAHAVGIVHRDFKPDNVMVGRDGRVRVVDFGLARVAARARSRASRPSFAPILDVAARSDELTRAGTMLGTPAYMSPEQDAGLEAVAASDQFSFCVALYEALYRRLPFDGDTYPALVVARADGAVVAPPVTRDVTSRVRRAIVVGLRPQPAERHASMGALLAELEQHARKRVPRWAIAAAGVMALGATGTVLFARSTSDAADPCEGAGNEIALTWNPARRAQISAKLDGVANAQELLDGVDRWTAAWATERTAVCTAMFAEPQPTKESKPATRLQCLQQRATELDAKLRVVLTLDRLTPQMVENTLGAMPPAGSECTSLAGGFLDDDERARAMPVMKLAIEARQAQNDTKFGEAIALATQAVALARQLNTPGALAAALQTLGGAQTANGLDAAARASYREAALAAAAAHEDGMVADAWLAMLQLSFHDRVIDETVDQALLAAKIATARLDPDDRRRPMFHYTAGTIEVLRGKLTAAAAEIEEAIAGWSKDAQHNAGELGIGANSLGLAYLGLGEWAKAKAAFEQARDGLATFGPDTPQLGTVYINLGTVEARQAHWAAAESLLGQGLAVYHKLRDDHPLIADGELNVASFELERGRCDRAKPHLAKARAVMAANPPAPAQESLALTVEARCTADARTALATLARARSHAERARLRTQLPEIDFRTAEAIVRARGDRAHAVELATSARAAFQAIGAGTALRVREIDRWLAAHKGRR